MYCYLDLPQIGMVLVERDLVGSQDEVSSRVVSQGNSVQLLHDAFGM
jgi:hypothetical protein